MDILFDITKAMDAYISLHKWLKISVLEARKYLIDRGNEYSAEDFLEYFGIPQEKLLEDDLYLVSLHVITNNDNCNSLRKYGLRNLQEAIQLDTPLGNYIKEHGIIIDFNEGVINYKDKRFDINNGFQGFSADEEGKKLDIVMYKLFKDSQISAFLCYDNVLNYAGYVSTRPEFINDLADLFYNRSIENDWSRQENKCYVVKFKANISSFIDDTFSISKSDYEEHEDEPEQIELIKRKRLLKKALEVLFMDLFHDSSPEIFSYVKSDVIIPTENFIQIWTAEDYKKEYGIEGDSR